MNPNATPELPNALQSKILSLPQLVQKSRDQQSRGLKVVWTNGCFDLLHVGHISYLYEASELGDFFIIGLNSDLSVSRLKGPSRPIFDQWSRAIKLSALGFVDGLYIFSDKTPIEPISQILPDVLVKGGDYRPEEIVGADVVTAHGGMVRTIPYLEGYSSSYYINKIKGECK